MCEKLAQSLHHLTTSEERQLFDFGNRGGENLPVVMLLDRKEDPVTPLLLQWTYQAMVHELIGLDANRADLTHVSGVSCKPFQSACRAPNVFHQTPIFMCVLAPVAVNHTESPGTTQNHDASSLICLYCVDFLDIMTCMQ